VSAPGVIEKEIEASVPTTPSVDVARNFVCGLAERGPVGVAVQCQTDSVFEAVFGREVSYGYLPDAARWLPDGGSYDNWFSRVVGPAAKQGSVKLVDGSSVNTFEILAANAKGDVDPGAWSSNVKVKTTLTGSTTKLEVLYEGVLVEETPFPLTRAELLAWVKASAYIRLKDLGGGEPKTQEVTLSGGTDDRANITITQWEAAQKAFLTELGPGQLAWPGQTTKAARVAMAEHAKLYNRVVVPDGIDTRTKATHLSAAEEWSTVDKTLRRCSFLPFAPWIEVASAEGVTKTLPPSIFVLARIAAHDAETYSPTLKVNNPNDPAAGKNGILDAALGLSQESWTDTEREELKLAINVIRWVIGQARIYGYRTMANPLTDPNHTWGSNRRIDMALKARGQVVAEDTVLGQVDSKGHKLGELEGALKGVCQPYFEIGALFEDRRPGVAHPEAYSIDVSEGVNPIKQLFEGKVRGVIDARRAPAAETVEIDYTVEGVS